jgi:chaperone modulatory protein CbpM
MTDAKELVEMIDRLLADALQGWIDLDWVRPQRDGVNFRFDVLDVARIRLICELHHELRIEEDSMSVVLSLMDQLYRARRSLRSVSAAVEAQPEEVRTQIAALLERHEPRGRRHDGVSLWSSALQFRACAPFGQCEIDVDAVLGMTRSRVLARLAERRTKAHGKSGECQHPGCGGNGEQGVAPNISDSHFGCRASICLQEMIRVQGLSG